MKRNFAVLPILVLVYAIASPNRSLAQQLRADSLAVPMDTIDFTNKPAPQFDSTFKNISRNDVSLVDSAKFYKILPTMPSLFTTPYRVANADRDFIYHRILEDYFSFEPHFFLRDKVELGQVSELLINGLGSRYQALLLDDILLNDVVSSQAVFGHLSTESFSELNLFRGFSAVALSASPFALESKTETIVAAKGYTKIHYFQFSGSTNKMDITFALNLSERWSFYGGYVREGAEGVFRNSSGFGAERFGSSSEANKLRIRLRFQYSSKTYFTFAFEKNSLNLKPYGGADLAATLATGETDVFSPLSSIIVNEFAEQKLGLTFYKLDFRTALPFIPLKFQSDSLNSFKSWVAFSQFENTYQTTVSTERQSILSDFETSSRISIGATQSLKLFFFSLQLRGVYHYESVLDANTLRNTKGETAAQLDSQRPRISTFSSAEGNFIFPTAVSLELTGAAKARFDRLIFGQALEFGASAGLFSKSIANTRGQDFSATFFSSGFGGEVNFPLTHSGDVSLKAFANGSSTSRIPSLREVFSATDVQGSQSWSAEQIRQFEFGVELSATTHFLLRLNSITSIVNSPYAVVKRYEGETPSLQYQALNNESLSYSGLGVAAWFHFGAIESSLKATAIFDYSIFSNPNRAFENGLLVQGDSVDARSRQVFYLPRFSCNGGVFFRRKLFEGNLDLKIGFAGYVQSAISSSLQNRERVITFYFNLIEQQGALRDNNLQFGTLRPKASMDFQIWAGIKSGMIFFFVENVFDSQIFRAPIFPAYPQSFRLGVNWEILD